MFRVACAFVIALSSAVVWALDANERGNGGDVIVRCKDVTRPAVQFYDLYEAEYRHGMKPVAAIGATALERATNLIGRLHKLNPNREKLYLEWLQTFYSEIRWATRLIDVPDTGAGFIPHGCDLEQLIVQNEPVYPGDKRYTINQELWDQMDLDNQAAAIVHELILREASLAENNHQTSEPTRYLHALIESDWIGQASAQGWVEKLTLAKFARADAGLNAIRLDPQPTFYDPDHFKEVWMFEAGHLDSKQLSFDYECRGDDSGNLIPEASFVVGFHLNGNIQVLQIKLKAYNHEFYDCHTSNPQILFSSKLQDIDIQLWKEHSAGYSWAKFYENGMLESSSWFFFLEYSGKTITYDFSKIYEFTMWDNGRIKDAATWTTASGIIPEVRVVTPGFDGIFSVANFLEDGSLNYAHWGSSKNTFLVGSTSIKDVNDVYLYGQTWAKEIGTGTQNNFDIQFRQRMLGALERLAPDGYLYYVYYLHPSTALRCARLIEDESLQNVTGAIQTYAKGTKLMFTETGIVEKVILTADECNTP